MERSQTASGHARGPRRNAEEPKAPRIRLTIGRVENRLQ